MKEGLTPVSAAKKMLRHEVVFLSLPIPFDRPDYIALHCRSMIDPPPYE